MMITNMDLTDGTDINSNTNRTDNTNLFVTLKSLKYLREH